MGGDATIGPTRCVDRGWQLREAIRERQPDLQLGGWANPHKDAARQVAYLLDPHVSADFYLTQVVSHHDLSTVERFLNEATHRGLRLPGLLGIFYYRSAKPDTLGALGRFLPVPREGLIREFSSGATAEEACARSVRALRALGVRHVYISNLPAAHAAGILGTILRLVDEP